MYQLSVYLLVKYVSRVFMTKIVAILQTTMMEIRYAKLQVDLHLESLQ